CLYTHYVICLHDISVKCGMPSSIHYIRKYKLQCSKWLQFTTCGTKVKIVLTPGMHMLLLTLVLIQCFCYAKCLTKVLNDKCSSYHLSNRLLFPTEDHYKETTTSQTTEEVIVDYGMFSRN
ncbi:hypothetical protein STEG23_012111, partial [Scotinomys teguina]